MLLCCPYQVWTVFSFSQLLLESLEMGEESHPAAQNFLIFPTRKIPLNKFTSFVINSIITSPLNISFHVIALDKLYL